jgi:hypothetical protein
VLCITDCIKKTVALIGLTEMNLLTESNSYAEFHMKDVFCDMKTKKKPKLMLKEKVIMLVILEDYPLGSSY